ncbi:T9SS type A sorting domain-containing protein [Lacibacter sp. H375]|uniref:T9SS type A sorting domain-containing protein n=1 Tax=Lacibacter sp. H375 TaxID=3133424 RepID=UPI0030C2ADD1
MTKNYLFFFLFVTFFSVNVSSAQTETEPNNKFEQCNQLTFGSSLTGTFNKANDSDFYCIQVPNISALNITIDQVTGNAPVTIHVFNPDKSYLGVSSVSAGGTINFSVLACGAGTYYFMVFESSRTMAGPTYRLGLTTNSADQYECNNTLNTATSIGNSSPISASIDYDNDEDNFTFDITQEELLTVTVNPVPSNVQIGVALYDNTKTKIAETIGSSSGSNVSLNKQIQPGKYYIRLRSQNISWSSSLYTFNMTHSVITSVGENEQRTAIKLYPNPTKSDLFVQFNNAELFSYRRIKIYDANGKLVYSVDKPIAVNSFAIKTAMLPAGVYLLQVIGGKKVEVRQFVIAK